MKQKTPGNLSDKIDRDLLHDYMWRHSDRSGRFLGKSGKLAEDLGINPATMSIIFREMSIDGRIQKVGSKYIVKDPRAWAWSCRSIEPPDATDIVVEEAKLF